jgi:hypothetical protein
MNGNIQNELSTMRKLTDRISRLEADLAECQEYLERHYMDVVDGDDGRPAPNEAMRLVSMIKDTLHGEGNY